MRSGGRTAGQSNSHARLSSDDFDGRFVSRLTSFYKLAFAPPHLGSTSFGSNRAE